MKYNDIALHTNQTEGLHYNEIDYIKTLALFWVCCLHFVSGEISGWITTCINSPTYIVRIMLFLITETCVPIFFICSGFNLANRTFSWNKHYKKVGKVIVLYFVAALMCGMYRYIKGENFREICVGLFTGSTAHYSWYVKYYIILYIMIPGINYIYHKCKNIKVIILVLVVVTAIGNNWRYALWVENSVYLTYLFKVLKNLFPILYYVFGCFLKDYYEKIEECGRKINNICIYGIVAVIFTISYAIFLYEKYKFNFLYIIPNGYGAWNVIVLSFLIFNLIYNIFRDRKCNEFITKISSCTLIAYLVSYISDDFFNMIMQNYSKPLRWYYIVLSIVSYLFAIIIGIIGTDFSKKIMKLLRM